MGWEFTLDKKVIITSLILLMTLVNGVNGRPARANRLEVLKTHATALESAFPNQFGFYVKDLGSGEEFSWRGEESWYLASGIKVPVAIEVLRQIELKRFALDTPVLLNAGDYVDGAGHTNRKKQGSQLPVHYLFREMLIYSDNTATDLLIKLAGLENIHRTLRKMVPQGFSEITTLADVRRHVYGFFHPAAFELEGQAFLKLRRTKEHERAVKLATLIGKGSDEFKSVSLSSAYESYYGTNLNSGTLKAYTQLLESLFEGNVLNPESKKLLIQTMIEVRTGKNRIKAGLPRSAAFAHKTGTQYERACDFGLIWKSADQLERPVIIAACTRQIAIRKNAEKVLRLIGQALTESGVLNSPAPVSRQLASER